MKTKIQAVCVGLAALLFAAPSWADVRDIIASDRSVEFDAGLHTIQYGETNSGATLDTENGNLVGFNLGGTWIMSPDVPTFHDVYIHADLDAALGDTHYSGATFGGTPLQQSTHDQIFVFSTKVGRAFVLGDSVLLTPFADLGFRGWQRKLTGNGGYTEYYENGQALGGLLLQYSPVPRLVFSATGEFGNTFGSSLKGLGGSHVNPGDSSIYQFGGKVGYTITPKFELTAGAGFKGFGFGKSNVGVADLGGGLGLLVYEPRSFTHELTVTTGLAYHLQ